MNDKNLKIEEKDKRKNESQNENMNKNKNIKHKAVPLVIFLLAIFLAIFVFISLIVYKHNISEINIDAYNNLNLPTTIYDKDGNKIEDLSSTEYRENINYQDIPKVLIDAITSTEDKNFFKHNGTDFSKSFGYLFNKIFKSQNEEKLGGGNTITQQLVKEIYVIDKNNLKANFDISSKAIAMENKISKEDIFKTYVNMIYFGDGVYGVSKASKNYFGKELKDINLAEAATLAALIDYPEYYNPYKSEDLKQKLIQRQKLVLKQMLNLKKITEEQYNQAINYNLVFKKSQTAQNIHSYYVDAVISQVVDDLVKQKNMDSKNATMLIYNGSLKIYTPFDKNVQNAIDDAYDKNIQNNSEEKNTDMLESAIVVLDSKNSNVLGLIGGTGKKDKDNILNRATDMTRQPGSLFIPLAAYVPAFEKNIITLDTIIDDSPINENGYIPKNYSNKFLGNIKIKDAIAKNLNVPAIKVIKQVGVNYSYDLLKSFGITTLEESDKSLVLSIGGISKGTKLIEIANAYATLANGGMYNDYKLYTKVIDSKNNQILSQDLHPKQVIKESTAKAVTTALKVGQIKDKNLEDIDVAAISGNTNQNYDKWYVKYTPDYSTVCWSGYDEIKKIDDKYLDVSKNIVDQVILKIHKKM